MRCHQTHLAAVTPHDHLAGMDPEECYNTIAKLLGSTERWTDMKPTPPTPDLNQFRAVSESGKAHTEFDTGSRRDNREGKGRYDLITPIGLKRLAVHYENGAKKYDDRNWEKGQPLGVYLDSAIRHIYAFIGGGKYEDHLAAAAWNILACIHTEDQIKKGNLPEKLDNLP